MQDGSAEIAQWAGGLCARLGLHPVRVVPVVVGVGGGPEAAARDARYAALAAVAADLDADAVLLGHTIQDQAETVLLRLARGSGARSLSAMASVSGLWRRPMLGLDRADVAVAAAEALTPLGERAWIDPHNDDRRFARVRVRAALRDLQDALGQDVVPALARSAALLRDDADALDDLAAQAAIRVITVTAGRSVSADAQALMELPRAVRTRVIREMCLRAGSLAEDLTADHVATVERLVSEWSGQGPASLPGRVTAHREYGRLAVTASPSME